MPTDRCPRRVNCVREVVEFTSVFAAAEKSKNSFINADSLAVDLDTGRYSLVVVERDESNPRRVWIRSKVLPGSARSTRIGVARIGICAVEFFVEVLGVGNGREL